MENARDKGTVDCLTVPEYIKSELQSKDCVISNMFSATSDMLDAVAKGGMLRMCGQLRCCHVKMGQSMMNGVVKAATDPKGPTWIDLMHRRSSQHSDNQSKST
jgi:hypothetical protein